MRLPLLKKLSKVDQNNLSLRDHSRILRNKVLVVLGFFLVTFAIFFSQSQRLVTFAMSLGKDAGYTFVYLSPPDVIVQQLRLSSLAAIVICLPVAAYEFLSFIRPIFSKKSSFVKVVVAFIVAAILYAIGVLFAYKILLPFALQYFKTVGTSLGLQGQASIKDYIGFIITILSSIALTFELPLICVSLDTWGVVDVKALSKARSVVIVTIFIIAAIITPPDVFTQCMVAIPMVLLFECSILICRIIETRGRSK